MTAIAEPAVPAVDDRLAARNALVLAAAQALAGANVSVIVATGGIAGATLAPDPTLATLPISVMIIGMWLGTMPVGVLAQAFGRRFALQTGSAFGAVSGVISCFAMLRGSFLLLLFGALCGGLYAAAQQSYRFRRYGYGKRTVSGQGYSVGAGGRRLCPRCLGRNSSSSPRMFGRPICLPEPIWRNQDAPCWPPAR